MDVATMRLKGDLKSPVTLGAEGTGERWTFHEGHVNVPGTMLTAEGRPGLGLTFTDCFLRHCSILQLSVGTQRERQTRAAFLADFLTTVRGREGM